MFGSSAEGVQREKPVVVRRARPVLVQINPQISKPPTKSTQIQSDTPNLTLKPTKHNRYFSRFAPEKSGCDDLTSRRSIPDARSEIACRSQPSAPCAGSSIAYVSPIA
eukprot:3169046-Rhodomonas_salina.1